MAISNNRLFNVNDGRIRFYVKDYKKGSDSEPMILPVDEFICRFLKHILPRRFRKIHYAGILAPAIRDEKLKQAGQSLQKSHIETDDEIINLHEADLSVDFAEKCTRCHVGRMRTIIIDRM